MYMNVEIREHTETLKTTGGLTVTRGRLEQLCTFTVIILRVHVSKYGRRTSGIFKLLEKCYFVIIVVRRFASTRCNRYQIIFSLLKPF